MLCAFKSISFLKCKINNSAVDVCGLIFKKLNFILSAVDFRILYNSLKRLLQHNLFFGLKGQKVSFFSYIIKKRLTVNKSPFVNKKSKSQYELRLFGSRLSYFFYNVASFSYFF